MSTTSTALIARKSIRARLGRTIAILLSVTASVSFVVGSFVLADSLQDTFDNLFTELNEDIDLSVRSAEAFDGDGQRDPVDAALADQILEVDGVEAVEPTIRQSPENLRFLRWAVDRVARPWDAAPGD